MKKAFIYTAIVLVLISCNRTSGSHQIITGFNNEIYLTPEILNIFPTGCFEKSALSGDFLILIDNHCDDYLVQLINLKTGESKKVIKKGRGPAEFLLLHNTGHREGDSLLYRSGNSLVWLNPKVLWQEDYSQLKEIEQPFQDIYCFHIGNQWVYSSLSGDGLLSFFRPSKQGG
jgi:hypothetical protein